ncbi:hypothetical protein HY932_00790 [Candidatus Falkowbacteria bacterium]|nr:hypothetical protein [Candidatus Falkowbacteria bacterium]
MKKLLLAMFLSVVGCCVMSCTRRMQEDEQYGMGKEQVRLSEKTDAVQWINPAAGGASVIVTWHPSGTLLKDAGSANVYVIEGSKKHWIADEAIFNAHGWKWEQIIIAAPEEMACYEESWVVNWQPKRVVFQALGNDSFYMLEKESEESDCMIYPMPTLLALKTWGANVGQVEVLSGYEAEQKYFNNCELSAPLFVRAGALVKPLFSVDGFGAGVIFVADGNGTLRPFLNYEVFSAMGYENAPVNTCENEDEFYASFVKFGPAISFETATMCAAPQGLDPEEENEEPFVAVDASVFPDEPADAGADAYCNVDQADGLPAEQAGGAEVDEQNEILQPDVVPPDAGLWQDEQVQDVASQENVEIGGDVDVVECEIKCPSGMNAWLWYGANGELSAVESLKLETTKAQICERGFPWVDYNCAKPDWSEFDPLLAQVQCDHSFVNHEGVIDFNGEGELFFDDFVCFEWKPPVAKSCGNKCVALSAYYLYRADFALVDIEPSGAILDFSSAQKIAISADEYYHVGVGNVSAGMYKVKYSTVNGEQAYFGGDISLSL